MGNSAKEKRQYIIINVLLILIVLLLGVYIYKVIQSNKQQIKVGYEQGVNVVQQLQDEYINVEKVETTENQNTMVVPIDDSNRAPDASARRFRWGLAWGGPWLWAFLRSLPFLLSL